MGKVYESDVDPDEFIRSFRDEPSGTAGLKKAASKKEAPRREKHKEASAPEVSPSADAEDAEDEYRRIFLLDLSFLRAQEKFQPVEIDPEFVRMIRRIISYDKKQMCTVKAYVNNVLAHHFRLYAAIIEKRL